MNNKIFTILIVLFSLGLSQAKADIIVQTTDVTFTPGTEFTVPIKIYGISEGGTPISSANIVISFDTAALQFMQLINFNPRTPQNQWFFSGNNNTGMVAANWLEPNLDTVALPDGSTLYEIKFKAKPGACLLTFITYEFTDYNYDPILTTADNGSYASIQQVTFQVDMRDQQISNDGVHLAGTFNDWSTTATTMTPGDSSVYSVTLQLISDSVYYFRYVNGNTTGGYEIVPAACGVPSGNDYNRTITPPAGDTSMQAICFSSCSLCPPQIIVTFQVDMGDQIVSPHGVHLAGTFNNWNPAATLMNNLGNDIFGVTLALVPEIEEEYRFVNGNTTAGFEIVPANCGVPAGGGLYNRFLMIPETDSTLIAVCFSNCSECLSVQSVTFKVDMSDTIISSNGVHLAGSFNGFNTSSIPMTNLGNDVYTATLDLLENEQITYRYVNGNDASGFETVLPECGVEDGNGIYNRELTIPHQDTILAEICFSHCEDCAQQPWEKDVTFQVDMSKETISTDGIHLAGTFNGWDPAINQMIPLGNNIYSTTLTLNEDDIHQYRFVNGNTADGYETVPEECGFSGTSGSLERQIIIPSQDTTLEAMCFSTCSSCVIYQLTLRVDMMKQDVSVFGVHVAGSFNNWNTGDVEMISSGSSIYEVTVQVYEGDTVHYRFVNGNQSDGMEQVPADCGIIYNGQDYARQVIPVNDTVAEAICYSWCDPCDVGILERPAEIQIGKLYPNPAQTSFKLPVYLPETADILISLTNLLGATGKTESFSLPGGFHEIEMNTAGLPDGIYLVSVIIIHKEKMIRTTEKMIIKR